eukprot:2697698-Prymnesium_polylepis.1
MVEMLEKMAQKAKDESLLIIDHTSRRDFVRQCVKIAKSHFDHRMCVRYGHPQSPPIDLPTSPPLGPPDHGSTTRTQPFAAAYAQARHAVVFGRDGDFQPERQRVWHRW